MRTNEPGALLLHTLWTAFVFAALAMSYKKLAGFDHVVMEWVSEWRHEPLTLFFQAVTRLGDAIVEYVILFFVILLLASVKKYRQAVVAVFCLVGGWALNTVLKGFFERERPTVLEHLAGFDYFSFPSGHAMVSTCFYGYLAFLVWLEADKRIVRMGAVLAAVTLILLIAISRIYLGVHYPTDSLAGIAAGASWLMLNLAILRGWQKY